MSVPNLSRYSLKSAAEVLFLHYKESDVSTRPALPTDFNCSSFLLFNLSIQDTGNRADGFGSWTNEGGKTNVNVDLIYSLNNTTQVVSLPIQRIYFRNATNFSIKRQEYRLIGTTKVLMVYIIPSSLNVMEFRSKPHGNSNLQQPYQRIPSNKTSEIEDQIKNGMTPIQV